VVGDWRLPPCGTVATREWSRELHRVSTLRASVNYREAWVSARQARRAHLSELYYSGKPFRLIAAEYGGTRQGVCSTIRKMVERGALAPRRRPERGEWA
jgi:hypothetical protein